MTEVGVRFRLVGRAREAELGRYLIRIDVQLGPEELPLAEREAGFRIQGLVTHSTVVLWEDWRPTLAAAKESGAAWLAGKLGATAWGFR